MIQGNLALKLEDFEEDYCNLRLVDDCDQSLPDNIIQFPTVDNGQGQALSLQYDDNGNLVRKDDSQGAIDYSWDYENRLVGVDYLDGSSDSYTYDGVGKRIQTSENGIVTNYLYDGLNCIIEQDNTGLTTASYVRGLGYSGGIGSIISKQGAGGSPQYYYYDGIGNVVDIADHSSLITRHYEYDAYGNILNNVIPSSHGFSTKEFSRRSGLSYFGARYYDSRIGRWTQPDPLGMVNGPNMYLYVNNNPVNKVDPYGLFWSWSRDTSAGASSRTSMSARQIMSQSMAKSSSRSSGSSFASRARAGRSGFGSSRPSKRRTTTVVRTTSGGRSDQKTRRCRGGFWGSLKDQLEWARHPLSTGAGKSPMAQAKALGKGYYRAEQTLVGIGSAALLGAGAVAIAPVSIPILATIVHLQAQQLPPISQAEIWRMIGNQIRTTITLIVR